MVMIILQRESVRVRMRRLDKKRKLPTKGVRTTVESNDVKIGFESSW